MPNWCQLVWCLHVSIYSLLYGSFLPVESTVVMYRHSPFRHHKTKDKHEIDRMTLNMVRLSNRIYYFPAKLNNLLNVKHFFRVVVFLVDKWIKHFEQIWAITELLFHKTSSSCHWQQSHTGKQQIQHVEIKDELYNWSPDSSIICYRPMSGDARWLGR